MKHKLVDYVSLTVLGLFCIYGVYVFCSGTIFFVEMLRMNQQEIIAEK